MAYRVRSHRLGRHATESSIEVSCGLLDIMDGDTIIRRVMTDCGLASHTDATGKKVDFTPDFSILQDGKKIDAVRLTHMHLDHAGSVPLIVPYLARDARVFVTKTSAAMMPTVLKETLKIAEKRGQQPLYSESAYDALMNRVTMIERPGEIEIAKGFMDYVHPAGHMPGACSFTTRVGNVHLHYAGDRCTHDQPGTRGATPIPEQYRKNCIVFGCDCTYGADYDSDSRVREQELARAVETATQAMSAGGIALFHTFATRGASMAAELSRYFLPDVGGVYLDGSTRTYADIVSDPSLHWSEGDSAPLDRGIDRIEAMTASEARGGKAGKKERPSDHFHRLSLADGTEGFAVLGTPGMGGPGGVATFWRQYVLEDPNAAMIFTGYVAGTPENPETDGAIVLAAAKERELHGSATVRFREEKLERVPDGKRGYKRVRREITREYDLKCKVIQVRLGAHESRSGILDWFRDEMKPMAAVLNHGSKAALDSLAAELRGTPGMLDGGIYPCHEQPTVEFDL